MAQEQCLLRHHLGIGNPHERHRLVLACQKLVLHHRPLPHIAIFLIHKHLMLRMINGLLGIIHLALVPHVHHPQEQLD